MGTPEFAVPSMIAIHENFELVGVITAPDKKAGRGHKLQASAVKKSALDLNLPILQPTNLKDPEFQDELRGLEADVFVVVAFRMLPESVWSMPKLGTINLHASLLPQYRGAAPIHWAVMNGEPHSGLTTFLIRHEIDTGAILLQKEMRIGEKETTGSLHDRMMEKGGSLLVDTLNAFAEGKLKPKPQEEFELSQIKKAPKLRKPMFYINKDWEAEKIFNHIRGLSPYPAALLPVENPEKERMDLKIYLTEAPILEGKNLESGLIREGNRLFLQAKNGRLEILEMQIPGKKRLKTQEILNGMDINSGWKWLEAPSTSQ